MSYLDDFAVGATVRFKFTTRRFTTGAPHTLVSGAISVYKDGSATESTAGVTLVADFDSKTGINDVVITLVTDGTFYSAGSEFVVWLSAGTVDSVSVVGEVVAQFSIANRPLQSIGANVITATSINADAITAAKVANGTIDAATFAAGAIDAAALAADAGTEIGTAVWATATRQLTATQTFALTGNITGNLSGSVGSVTGAVGSVTGAVGSVGAGGIAAASFAANAIDAAALAADAGTEIGTAVWATATRQITGTQTFNVTGNITGNLSGSVGSVTGAVGSVTGAVGSVAAGGIAAASFAAGAIDATAIAADAIGSSELAATAITEIQSGLATAASIAALNNLSAAAVNAEVVDALATDTYAEPTGVPASTDDLATKIGHIYAALRNQVGVTSGKKTFYDDADVARWEKDLSDDGTTYSESKGNAP